MGNRQPTIQPASSVCEQAPALHADRRRSALNHNGGSLQKVINIARWFTFDLTHPNLSKGIRPPLLAAAGIRVILAASKRAVRRERVTVSKS